MCEEFYEKSREALVGLPPLIMATVLDVNVLFMLFLSSVLKFTFPTKRLFTGDLVTFAVSPSLTTLYVGN